MQLSKILVFTVSVAVLALHVPGLAEAAKKNEDDGRVCVRLGVETNHPLEEVCTRKVVTVEAAKWYKDKESVHFVFPKSSEAYKAGHIQYSMEGGVSINAAELNFCVMEVPTFRGTPEQVAAHNESVLAAHYFAAKNAGLDLTGIKSASVAPRNKDGYFPSDCDIVSATGESWKKSWTKVIEDVSMRSSRNSKFGQEFKQGFTNAIDDLALAVSLSPADIEQGALTAKAEIQKARDERQAAKAKNVERMAGRTADGGGERRQCRTVRVD